MGTVLERQDKEQQSATRGHEAGFQLQIPVRERYTGQKQTGLLKSGAE